MNAERIIRASRDELHLVLAEEVLEASEEAIAARGRFLLAISGGKSPRPLYELLASPQWRARLDWRRTHLFWADERAVPTNDPSSNYGAAHESLLRNIPIPPANIHRMQGEADDLNQAAYDYEALLRQFGTRLDLVLLGMGPDGHTASLFPGSVASQEVTRLCIPAPIAPLVPHVSRLTLTLPCLNAARRVCFLVTGSDKTQLLARVFGAPDLAGRIPAQEVKLTDGRLMWFLDAEAAQGVV